MRRRRNPEVIAGRVNADGSIAAMTGGEFTVAKGAVGAYTVTFPPGFRLISFVGDTNIGSGIHPFPAVSGNVVTVANANTSTLGASDSAWQFTAVGVQT